MSKTAFSKKCEILGSIWLFYKDESNDKPAWKDFFEWADLALPLSYMVWLDIVSIKKTNNGKDSIESAWDKVCSMIDVDPNESYSSLTDFFGKSAMPEPERKPYPHEVSYE